MAADDTVRIDPVPIRVAEARRIEDRYGGVVWFGYWTRRWWALVDEQALVHGATPTRLGEAIVAVRRRDALA
ncbi:hypothetical protein [Spirillospora sp. CA-128828]|uniref:hypothetical protein n=1 Tax=Spirillospora sp. CA-128828 TaxID=3240033 RepID=UPI003D935D68